MGEKAQTILAAIRSLSEKERWEIIDGLLESESPPDNYAGMTEEEFQAEMIRRCQDTDPGVPWPEVKA